MEYRCIHQWVESAYSASLDLLATEQCDSNHSLENLLARAEAALQLHRYDIARSIAAEIAVHPDRYRDDFRCLLLSLTARLQLVVGSRDDALTTFTRALECVISGPQRSLIEFQWALVLECIGNIADALEQYATVLSSLDSTNTFLWVATRCGIARLHAAIGEYEHAMDILSVDDTRIEPDFAQGLLITTAASIVQSSGDSHRALELLRHVRTNTLSLLGIEQELVLVRAQIALDSWDAAGSTAEALTTRTEELSLPYHAALAHLEYGRIFADRRSPYYSPPIAIEHFKRALRHASILPPTNLHARIHYDIGTVYRTIGYYEKALHHVDAHVAVRDFMFTSKIAQRIKQATIDIATKKLQLEIAYERDRFRALEQQLKVAETTIEQLQHRMDEQIAYLGTVAHDLKNPIAAIMMSAAIIERYGQKLSKADLEKHVSSITRTAEWMKELVTGLLDFAALTSGKLKLTIEPVHAALIFDVVIEAYQIKALAKSLSIIREYTENELYVFADSKRLQECLDNLLSNAIKYSPLGRSIYCRIERRGNTIRLAVRDEGPGLSTEEQRRLFGEFSRAGSHDTGKEGGTGLGLSIVRRFIEAMNGTVGCESQLGNGSTFFIELPIVVHSSSQEQIPTHLPSQATMEK
ncbi:MAG: HAMP domain-containing histidine kinase [Chlorobi bacterium]|nr:HAMP domain-containing histidine kinase [Chlorobiota bacterium]